MFFSDSDIFESLDMKQSDFPLGIKKYVHLAEAPKRGILYFGSPGTCIPINLHTCIPISLHICVLA